MAGDVQALQTSPTYWTACKGSCSTAVNRTARFVQDHEKALTTLALIILGICLIGIVALTIICIVILPRVLEFLAVGLVLHAAIP